MSNEFDREQLISIFVAEATDDMAKLWAALTPAERPYPTPGELLDQQTVGHKLKGASLLYGYPTLGQLGALLEMILDQIGAYREEAWPAAIELLRELVTAFNAELDRVRNGGSERADAAGAFKDRVDAFLAAAAGSSPSEPSFPDAYLVPTLNEEVLSYFAPEAEEYFATISTLLQRLDGNLENQEILQQLYRVVHSLKGSAYTVGFHVIGDVAHPIETCLIAAREQRVRVQAGWLPRLRRAVELLRLLLQRDRNRIAALRQDLGTLLPALCRMESGGDTDDPAAPSAVPQADGHARPSDGFPNAAAEGATGARALTLEYLIPNLDAEVLSYFVPEAQEYLEGLEALLLRLERESHDPDIIHQLFRTAHTLKGSAYTVGFQSIGDLTHHIEDFMGAVREGRLQVRSGHTDLLLRAIDVIRTLMRRDPAALAHTRERFAASMAEVKRLEQVGEDAVRPDEPDGVGQAGAQAGTSASSSHPDPTRGADAKTADEREVIRVSRDRVERLLNLVGELVIDRGRLEQRLKVLGDLSKQVLTNKARLVEAVHSFEEKHTFSFQPAPGDAVSSSADALAGLPDFSPLELDKYDDFNILARRISEVTADIAESMSQLNRAIRRAQDDMGQLQQLTLSMRDEVAQARMVPIGTPFTRFRRAAREMARATGKEVNLITSGEHTEIDTGVVERLVDPLVHLVRNAVYHGIESTAARLAKGKSAAGTVYLHAAHRGNAVTVEVEDDGAGLDIQKIKAKAVRLGLVQQGVADNLPESEIIKFIFVPGFSTADTVGDQAGRGVGLDVVKRVIETMNGHIEVESVRGQGTKFTLHLPLTLLIATALIVRVNSERYAIPLPSVREVTMASPASVQKLGDRSMLQIGEEAIEVHPLAQLLQRGTGAVEPGAPVVIVRTATGLLGCAVDELLGRQEIVIKSLGALRPFERSVFGGATIDPEGRIILVLDISRLTTREYHDVLPLSPAEFPALALEGPMERTADPERAPTHLPLLLIDDSLSIRKFVGRMLESAGYTIETAVDGEEGLRKASTQTFRLIITDLEMPKLNGFEVIQALRGRPQTQHTPILVMTTRAGEKHRQMAINIGASGYIAKPVEERALIQEIQRWLGSETAVTN